MSDAERSLSPLAPSNAPTAQVTSSPTRKGKVWLTYECEQGNRWRVYDIERIDRRPRLVPPGSRHATHRQFVIVGKYPQAVRYAFRTDEGEHGLEPERLQTQLYLAVRVKPPRRARASGSAAPRAERTPGTPPR
jgi:hypothetical protein